MSKIQSILDWLRITDENGVLSLTNLALFVVLARLALAPTVGPGEISGLVMGLLSYTGKKGLAMIGDRMAASQPAVVAVDPRVDELAKAVSTLQGVLTIKQSFGGGK